MIRYDPHAEFQMERRGITKQQVENVLREWDETETHGDKRSFLKCDPERGNMLRVVARDSDHRYVITAYYDRRLPCE